MKQIVRVLECLREVPRVTSREIAAELEMPLKTVSAHLSYLCAGGLAKKVGVQREGRFNLNIWEPS